MIKKIYGNMNMFRIWVMTLMMSVTSTVNAYATVDGEAQYNNAVDWLLGWIGRIGIVVGLWGLTQIAMSFSTEDAGQKRKGILELISGLMLMAIGYGGRTILGV